jgi:hypothetical protein
LTRRASKTQSRIVRKGGSATKCPICSNEFEGDPLYQGLICDACDQKAVGSTGHDPFVEPWYDSGENPVFVDGRRCYRRYRFGGWVTMVDECECECRSVMEFQNVHISGADEIICEASRRLAEKTETKPVRDAFAVSARSINLASRYRGAYFSISGRSIAAVRTQLVSSNARLIDSAVAFRSLRGADLAVAILDPPENSKRREDSGVTEAYRERYAAWAWHALKVIWVTADRLQQPWTVAPIAPPHPKEWLDKIATDARAALMSAPPFEGDRDSRLAEEYVRRHLCDLLHREGFSRCKRTSYASFWRKPNCDGIWLRDGESRHRLAIEVKVTEDIEAPFCQVMENLGESDSVLYIRVLNAAARRRFESLKHHSPQAREERASFSERAPVRFIDLDVLRS